MKRRDIEVGGGLRVHATCAAGHYYKWESTEFFNKVSFVDTFPFYPLFLCVSNFLFVMTVSEVCLDPTPPFKVIRLNHIARIPLPSYCTCSEDRKNEEFTPF